MSAAGSAEQRRRGLLALGAVLALLGLAGCSTTQDEAARLQLNSARIRASEVATIVRTAGHSVIVTGVSIVRSGHHSALVVSLRNRTGRAVGDLPISVGLRLGRHRREYLNARPATGELSYFAAHVPLIAAFGTLDWVYPTTRPLPDHARAFARVGPTPSPAVNVKGRAPAIEVRVVSGSGDLSQARFVDVAIRNPTSVPQYQLQVYAVARGARGVVAAGLLTVPHLGTHRSHVLKVPVVGRPGRARVAVQAPPTIVD